jgi:type I restriction enzyme S subunit
MSDSLIDLVENKPKLVPELRFPEFEDDGEWNEKKLLEISQKIMVGIASAATHAYRKSGVILFRNQNIKEGYLDDSDILFIDEEYEIIHKNKRLKTGDLLTARTGYPGTTSVVPKKYEGSQSFTTLITRPKQKYVEPVFLCFYINSESGQAFFESTKIGGGQKNVNAGSLSEMPVPLPSKEEQQKIASCLSSLDELITANREKLEALKAHKKGLMQNLFPQEGQTVPNYRFPEFENDGEWEEKKLGDKDVSFFVGEKISVDKLTTDSYISTENMLPDYSGVKTASKLPTSGSFTKFKIGDILISNIRPYLKKVWKSDKSGGASNDVFVFRSGSNVESEFLEFIIKNDEFINYVMKSVKGVKMPRGDKGSMREYSVFIPSKPEQQKIAACLTEVDKLISAQTEKIDRLLQHKKGLMQGLFPKNLD